MRKQTSLDIANAMLLYEIEKLKSVMHLMTANEITSDLAAIKRTYLEKSGWPSLYDSEIKKQKLDRYVPELNKNASAPVVSIYESKFTMENLEEEEEYLLEL